MKENIVRNAVDNFLQRSNLNSSTIREACERFLWESIREMRNEDPFLYEEMYDFSSRTQTRLLEERLEMEFSDTAEIIELFTESAYSSLKRAFEINECDGENYTEDYFKTVFEDCVSFMIEDSSRMQQLMESNEKLEKFKEKVKSSFTYLAKKLPSILPAAAAGFAAFGPLGIGASISVLLWSLIGSAIYSIGASTAFGVNVSKEQLELLKDTSGVMYRIAKAVKDGSEGIKHRYNVIYQNEDECYRKSGLDTKKLGIRAFASLKDDSFFRVFISVDDEDKLDKLRNCYLEHFLDKISIFFDLYFDCLRKTGKWNEVREMNDDKIISMFRMKGGLYPMCDQYRDEAVKAVRNFEDLVKFFFVNNPTQKSKWMLMLNRYILDAKASKDDLIRQNRESMDRNKRIPFTSKKYQRLGKDV